MLIPAGFSLIVDGDGAFGAGTVHDGGVDALISSNLGNIRVSRRLDYVSIVLVSNMFCYTYWKYRRCKTNVRGVPSVALTKDSEAAEGKRIL